MGSAPRRGVRAGVAVAMGGALALGLSACDGLPSDLPINIPSTAPSIDWPDVDLPTGAPEPQPVVTVVVTQDPEPQPTVTETVTADPQPQPTVTQTVKVTPEPQPRPTVTVTAQPGAPVPQPTVTVEVPVTVTPTPAPEPVVTPSPSVTASASPTPSVSPEEPGTPAEQLPWWPWLAGGIVLASLLAWWGIASSNRAAARRRFETARAQVAWFEGTLAPHVLSVATADEAAAAWQDGRGVVADIDRELYQQSVGAPTQVLRTAAAEGRLALGELMAALDAEAVPDAPMDADALRARHARVDAARARVRGWIGANVR